MLLDGLTWTATLRQRVRLAWLVGLQPLVGRRATFVRLVRRTWTGTLLQLVLHVFQEPMQTLVQRVVLTACLVSLTLTMMRLPAARLVVLELTPPLQPRCAQHVMRAGLTTIAPQQLRVMNARLGSLHLRLLHSAQTVLAVLLIQIMTLPRRVKRVLLVTSLQMQL